VGRVCARVVARAGSGGYMTMTAISAWSAAS
jgi:hypothetical protein